MKHVHKNSVRKDNKRKQKARQDQREAATRRPPPPRHSAFTLHAMNLKWIETNGLLKRQLNYLTFVPPSTPSTSRGPTKRKQSAIIKVARAQDASVLRPTKYRRAQLPPVAAVIIAAASEGCGWSCVDVAPAAPQRQLLAMRSTLHSG